MEETVLIYLEKDHKYLMLLKNKREVDINKGKWVGIGGHIEKGESIEQALIREVKEETNLDLLSYVKRGKLIFKNDDYEEIMYLFTSSDFKGELSICDEGELAWVDIDDVTSLNIWEGDKYFLEKLKTSNEYFEMTLIYKGNKLINVI